MAVPGSAHIPHAPHAAEFREDIASAPSSTDVAALQALATDLTALHYSVDGVEALLGGPAYAALGRGQLAPALLEMRRLLNSGVAGADEKPGSDEKPSSDEKLSSDERHGAQADDGEHDTELSDDAEHDGEHDTKPSDDNDDGIATAGVRAVPVTLWLLAEDVTQEQLSAAFPQVGVAGLERLRLIEPAAEREATGSPADTTVPRTRATTREQDELNARDRQADRRWRAAVELRPYSSDAGGDLWVASDLGSEQRPGPLRHDHVLGIGGASLTLARTVIRTPVDRALDLGTGCGIQAFHLLQHAGHVTVTDLSARALAFTRFNLLLNAQALDLDPARLEDRASLRLGSMLEPVAGELFDLVVSNPPFVITPRASDQRHLYTYRDGGLAGDAIVETLVRDVPSVLVPGGSAQLLGNWEVTEGTPWERRVRTFIPAGVDAWVIQREQLTPVQYAETWLRDAAEERDRETYLTSFAAYLEDFRSRNVEGIGFGSIWLRRPRNPSDLVRVTLEEITHEIEQPVAPHLATAVERADWLADHTEQAVSGVGIADQFLLVADDVTEERHQRPGAEHPGVILLRQGAGLRRTTLLTTELAGFVSACDGDLTAGQIAGALAMLLDRPDAAFTTSLLLDVEHLIREGFLIPAP